VVKHYKVLVSSDAQASLNYIFDHLTDEYSLQTAIKKERKLLEAIQSLKRIPIGHSQLRIKRKKSENPYRFMPVEHYKIIYTVEEEPDAIVIIIELIHDNMSMKRLEKLLP
jgi:plasmid stabilization system protein ParE